MQNRQKREEAARLAQAQTLAARREERKRQREQRLKAQLEREKQKAAPARAETGNRADLITKAASASADAPMSI